jgi:ATP-dependent protease HslVU (ClpYQ) ATPase subunit
MEKLLESISFNAVVSPSKKITVNAKYVNEQLKKLSDNEDLSQYIL